MEAFQHSPQAQGSRPPMSVIVIGGTPESDSGVCGIFTSPGASFRAGDQRHGAHDERSLSFDSTVPLSSSFRLMPRNPVPVKCTPSPTKSASRKRRAYSMGSDTSSGDEKLSAEKPSSPLVNDLLGMDGLSINCPARGDLEDIESPPKLGNQNIIRPRTSSFSVYAASPASIQRCNSGSLSGSTSSGGVAGRTPCSSARSSPRHVPLTVLSSPSQQVSFPSPLKLPPSGRPPFHLGAASMLQAIGVQRHNNDDEEEDGDENMILREQTMSSSTNIPSIAEVFKSPKDGRTPTVFSAASPRTPLPKVTLTPRTPLSGRHHPNSALPTFPAPADEEFSYTPTSPSTDDAIGLLMDDLIEGFAQEKPSHTAHFRTTGVLPCGIPMLTFNPDSSNSLAVSECTSPPGKESTPVRKNNGASSLIDLQDAIGQQPAIKTRSVMAPSESVGFLSEMLKAEARVAVMDAETGSLSDSDDEDFVLHCPATAHHKSERQGPSTEDNGGNHRARQRRRCDSAGLSFSGHGSSMTLTSDRPSSASLFGMDIVMEENHSSHSSSTQRESTPFSLGLKRRSSSTLSRRDGDYGSSVSLHRGRSELSLGSLGLNLESPCRDSGRDLVTPPVTIQQVASPPPLKNFHDSSRHDADGKKSSSVCICSSDQRSVNTTIAKMVSLDMKGLS